MLHHSVLRIILTVTALLGGCAPALTNVPSTHPSRHAPAASLPVVGTMLTTDEPSTPPPPMDHSHHHHGGAHGG